MPPTYNGTAARRRPNLKRDSPSLGSAHAAQDELGEPAGAFRIELARLAGGLEDEPQVLVGRVVAEPRPGALHQRLQGVRRRLARLGHGGATGGGVVPGRLREEVGGAV